MLQGSLWSKCMILTNYNKAFHLFYRLVVTPKKHNVSYLYAKENTVIIINHMSVFLKFLWYLNLCFHVFLAKTVVEATAALKGSRTKVSRSIICWRVSSHARCEKKRKRNSSIVLDHLHEFSFSTLTDVFFFQFCPSTSLPWLFIQILKHPWQQISLGKIEPL